VAEGEIFILARLDTLGASGTVLRIHRHFTIPDFQRPEHTRRDALGVLAVTGLVFPDQGIFVRMKQAIQLSPGDIF
jgi:hypothetical protein